MAKKIHCRAKRRANSPTHLKNIRHLNRKRASRPKTFPTKEAAESWAKVNGVKNFQVEQGTFSKKFRVVM